MLLRNLRPGVRKIQRHGEPATGVVIGVRRWPAGTIGVSRSTLTIQARFDHGTKATVKRYVTSHAFHGVDIGPGDKLPLRHDPADHAKVAIDFAEFRRRQIARGKALDAERVRDALAGEE